MDNNKFRLLNFPERTKRVPGRSKNKKGNCNPLLEMIIKDAKIFCDEFMDPFARVRVKNHFEIWPVSQKSRDFRNWLISRYFYKIGESPPLGIIGNVIDTVKALAWAEGKQYNLHVRTAWHQNNIYYDLANGMWQAVRIYPGGWEIVNDPPILFRRYTHMMEQPLPDPQGDPDRLMGFINIKDKNQRLLYLCSVITNFIPDIPHAVMVFHGQEGSTKSTTSKITRKVIDPSRALTCRAYTQKKEFIQYLAHNYCCVLDNLSAINDNLSDLLCSAVTGDGDTRRTLYTDDGDTIFVFKRSFIINGINNVVLRPDLLRRSVIFELHPPKPNHRMTERELWSNFDDCRAIILGGILNTLSRAIEIYPKMRSAGLYDMADFTLWGAAVAESLGFTSENFLKAYADNKVLQTQQAILNNEVANATTILMADGSEWSGSPTKLLSELENIAERERIKSRSWPKAANALMRRLNELRATLLKVGISIEDQHLGKKGRIVTLQKQENIVNTVKPLISYDHT